MGESFFMIILFFTTPPKKIRFEDQLSELWTVDRLWAEAHGLSTIIRSGKYLF
jgi:hypothetical protein